MTNAAEVNLHAPAPAPDDVTVSIIDAEDASLWDAAERFVYHVYRPLGYCEPDPREWVREHDAYRDGSRFVVAVDAEGAVVGTTRLVTGTFDELPAARCATGDWRPDGDVFVEFSAICTDPARRGLGIVNAVHRTALHFTVDVGAAGFAGAVEDWHGEYLIRDYGIPVRWVGDGRHYMGSHTRAFVVHLDEMWLKMAATHPLVYEYFAPTGERPTAAAGAEGGAG